MSQKGITVLTKEHFDMTQILKKGYPNIKEKFDHLWFGDQQRIPETKTVITEYFQKVVNLNPVHREKIKRKSKRSFSGRRNIIVKYPRSGRTYKARIRSRSGIAAIEPIKPNRAFWLVDKNLIDNQNVIDLNKVPHIRQIHNKEGREIMSDFR